MGRFYDEICAKQIDWRRNNPALPTEWGVQNRKRKEHILPRDSWPANLWEPIAGTDDRSVLRYLDEQHKNGHSGTHNLLSSWVLCANLYYPFRGEIGRQTLAEFLRANVSSTIIGVHCVELEYQHKELALRPAALLGEMDGSPGNGQTSPDVAFHVETKSGRGIVLVECKFVEHSFYRCTGRNLNVRNPVRNEDTSRCKNAAAVLQAPEKQCHLVIWKRRYWEHLKPVIAPDAWAELKACPAAFGGYQLFRQQALAEGIAHCSTLALVVSAVAFDSRNQELVRCMARSTGIHDFRTDWGKLFRGQTQFATFTHQAWVQWVREHNQSGRWTDWLNYVENRYGP